MDGVLSGLSEAQLRDWLGAVRGIAALDDAMALRELDSVAFCIAAAVQHAEDDLGEDLGRSIEEGRGRLVTDLAAARANLAHPSRIGPSDASRLRQSCYFAETDAERWEAREVAEELEAAFAGAQLERVLTDPIGGTASLPRLFRTLDYAVSELEKRGKLTSALEQRARAARERLARFRAQKKLDEAEVAEAGGNLKKGTKLRAEAGVCWAQD